VAQKFENWKKKFPESYKKAYGSESLKKISETYVLQEFFVWWDALQISPINFANYEWFEILSDFALWVRLSSLLLLPPPFSSFLTSFLLLLLLPPILLRYKFLR
jgi:hypothetical protein